MEPEQLMQCPYDKNHQIRASRFPYHLVKCQKNNWKIAQQFAICPFNARHRVPKQQLSLHIAACESKIILEVSTGASNAPKVASTWQGPPPQEDWEADADEFPAPPFILNVR